MRNVPVAWTPSPIFAKFVPITGSDRVFRTGLKRIFKKFLHFTTDRSTMFFCRFLTSAQYYIRVVHKSDTKKKMNVTFLVRVCSKSQTGGRRKLVKLSLVLDFLEYYLRKSQKLLRDVQIYPPSLGRHLCTAQSQIIFSKWGQLHSNIIMKIKRKKLNCRQHFWSVSLAYIQTIIKHNQLFLEVFIRGIHLFAFLSNMFCSLPIYVDISQTPSIE